MLMGEPFESVFYKVALKAMGQWLLSGLPLSILSSKGSQRVSAGHPGWADFPERGEAGPDTVCFAHVLISRAILHEYLVHARNNPPTQSCQ